MQPETAAGTVNSHCLEHIMALSDQHHVVATEDIVDDRGIKLWAKGQRVSRSLQEKLLRHKLAKPLETALTVDGGIMCEQVVAGALQKIEQSELLRRISGSAAARDMLAGFRDTPLPGPFKLLLTSARESGLQTFDHSMQSVALCAGIGARLNFGERLGQQLLMAALIHDIGELYVDPGYIRSNRRLAPHEWKQVAIHPRIGQMLIQQLTSLTPTISTAVAEHHERLDGSGYPAQQFDAGVSKLGRILAVADTAAAITAGGDLDKADRLAVAMRIVPEEFDHGVIRALIEPIDASPATRAGRDCLTRIQQVADRLAQSTQAAQALAGQAGSPVAADTCGYVLAALQVLDKALRASGAAEAGSIEEIVADEILLGEISLVACEVEWRLRNLARRIFLRVHINHGGRELDVVQPLIEALDLPLASR